MNDSNSRNNNLTIEWMTQTQEIITHKVLKIHEMKMKGVGWVMKNGVSWGGSWRGGEDHSGVGCIMKGWGGS